MTAASKPSQTYSSLTPGDPAPWFVQRSASNPRYTFDTAAGRYIVLCFFGTAGDEAGREAIRAALQHRHHFDDDRASFFGVSIDPADLTENRVQQLLPGIRYFWDFDAAVSRRYGAVPKDGKPGEPIGARRFWVVLDPTLRVMKLFALNEIDAVFAYLGGLPPPALFAGFEIQAPVLVLPNVFEPEFCQHLIRLYDAQGGEASGFMREVDGKTVGIHDRAHKVRKDYTITDADLIRATQTRISRRISPEIRKVHSFNVTRMERYLVGCYAAEDGGHFRAHRDNTTAGTAHRRFAVSINLNGEFEGGEVSFPEYGPRGFKPPPGGAVVFSCSLLHAVSKVRAGRRYAFLPFLYDDAAAQLREANAGKLEQGGDYRATPSASA